MKFYDMRQIVKLYCMKFCSEQLKLKSDLVLVMANSYICDTYFQIILNVGEYVPTLYSIIWCRSGSFYCVLYTGLVGST